MNINISVFIPAYNAEKTVASVLARIPKDAWQAIDTVFVLNDGSSDKTAEVVEGLKIKYPKILLHSFTQNRGYGEAVRKGLQLCRQRESDYSICLHADGQYPPEKLLEFVRYMCEYKIDILQGSRHRDGTARDGGMPRYKLIAGKCLTQLENLVFGLELSDYHSGYMFYSKRALEVIPIERLSRYFDFDVEVIASARSRGLKIAELGIPTHYGDEASYLNPITYGFRVLNVMFRYVRGYYNADA